MKTRIKTGRRKHIRTETIQKASQAVKTAEFERRKKYCKNYDPRELGCIQCYDNGTAIYKGCNGR